jgi:hypothetical protein
MYKNPSHFFSHYEYKMLFLRTVGSVYLLGFVTNIACCFRVVFIFWR